MAHREEGRTFERVFTLAEANGLLPHLEDRLCAIKRSKGVLVKTKPQIKLASANARWGGGSLDGCHYIKALEQIGQQLQTIQEMGVLVKDVESGLCDFPYMLDGRIVYLCWKLGEPEVSWWHETDSGFSGRQPLNAA
jgi:hypothetical protein